MRLSCTNQSQWIQAQTHGNSPLVSCCVMIQSHVAPYQVAAWGIMSLVRKMQMSAEPQLLLCLLRFFTKNGS